MPKHAQNNRENKKRVLLYFHCFVGILWVLTFLIFLVVCSHFRAWRGFAGCSKSAGTKHGPAIPEPSPDPMSILRSWSKTQESESMLPSPPAGTCPFRTWLFIGETLLSGWILPISLHTESLRCTCAETDLNLLKVDSFQAISPERRPAAGVGKCEDTA